MEGRSTARRASTGERTVLLVLALVLWMIALLAAASLRGVVPPLAAHASDQRTMPIVSAQRAAPMAPAHLVSR